MRKYCDAENDEWSDEYEKVEQSPIVFETLHNDMSIPSCLTCLTNRYNLIEAVAGRGWSAVL